MGSDSDGDFERFLQEDDSASVSSASPVKRNASATKKATSTKNAKRASQSRSSSSSGGQKPFGASLSVVAAAKKLLAGSARAKKKPAVVEEADEEDEAPPPYSEDPYTFDLGDAGTRYAHQTDVQEEENEEDDDGARTLRRRSKEKSKRDVSAKSKKSEGKKELPRRDAKPTRTLEERVAEILKRTGRTAAPTTGVSEEKKAAESDDDDDDDEKMDRRDEPVGTRERPPATAKANEVGITSAAHRSAAKETRDYSDDNSDHHRLSFSDSLGMESADFEVGALARRKLDQSRLSLSSLNSEKFAVNLEDLDESGEVSHNRYGRQNETFRPSVDTSDAADSEYGDEGFELDQTTDVARLDPPSKLAKPSEDVVNQSSFVSEFENMKNLFSLESPVKAVESAPVEKKDADVHDKTQAERQPMNMDNFGYDDEDFEAEDGNGSVEIERHAALETKPLDQSLNEDGYEDDEFYGAEEEPAVPQNRGQDENHQIKKQEQGLDQLKPEVRELKELDSARSIPASSESSVVLPRDVGISAQEISAVSEHAHQSMVALSHPPPAPMSPPPPPPPDDANDQDEAAPPPLSIGVRAVQPNVQISRRDNKLTTSVDRIRGIDQQVSSLRFVRDSPQVERWPSRRSREDNVQSDAPKDAEIAKEMEEIEYLMDHARRLRAERWKSVTVRSSAKESELALRLQQAQRQLLQFKQHVQELVHEDEENVDQNSVLADKDEDRRSRASTSSAGVNDGKAERGHREVILLRKENEQLKREIQSQERLIQGFQRENEQLMKQLKQAQRDMNYDVHEENEVLRVQLREVRMLLDGVPQPARELPSTDGIEGKIQFRAAVEARFQAEALAASLQEELEALAKRHQGRVNELKVELEKAKKAKIDLECRYEGINMEKMEAESRQIRTLNEQITRQKTEHSHALSALQAKINWYVANQRLLDEQDEKLNSLKEENKRLQELATTSGGAGNHAPKELRSPHTPSKGVARHPADLRRIQELESRLSDMEEAMRRRHPDSLVSLMVSSRKADEESKIDELKEQQQRQLAEMTDDMERIQAENEKKLTSFRQQQERLVLQYQKQITELERELANKENQRGGGPMVSNRVQQRKQHQMSSAEETELYRVRRFYAEKIKEVERKWEAKYRSQKKQHYAANGSDMPSVETGAATPRDAARLIRSLQDKIVSQDEHIQRNRGRSSTWESNDLRRRIQSLETQLKTSEEARRHLVETISALNAMAPEPTQGNSNQLRKGDSEAHSTSTSEFEEKMEAVQTAYEAKIQLYREQIETLERQVVDQSTARQNLLTQISSHVREVERLQKLLTEAEREKRRFQEAAERVPALESEVMQMRDQLAVPRTPSMLQFRSLELRIETLTQKHQLREAELKMLLAQATQSSQLEKLNSERLYQNAIALKNAEILHFKKQLCEILDELEALRQPPSSAP